MHMTLYDAALRALAQKKGVRRPAMPPGVTIVPVLTDDGGKMKAFLVQARGGYFPAWVPTLEDLTAQDWHVAMWRLPEGEACG